MNSTHPIPRDHAGQFTLIGHSLPIPQPSSRAMTGIAGGNGKRLGSSMGWLTFGAYFNENRRTVCSLSSLRGLRKSP
jgi:hypothetical protein